MKKTLVLLTLVAGGYAYSQGTVDFVTRNTGAGVNAVVTYGAEGNGPMTVGAKPTGGIDITSADGFHYGGINAKAGLYGGANGTARENLVLLVPSVGFRTGAAGGFVDPGTDSSRVVAGVPGGGLATFQLRAWDTGTPGVDSYEAARAIADSTRKVYYGESELLNGLTLGNFIPAGGAPTPPAPLAGLGSVTMGYLGVPEPSVIGLGILGALAGLMVFRRRS